MGLGIPGTGHFLVSEEWSPLLVRITHLAWKIQTALVDTLAARAYKTEFHLMVWSLADTNLLGTAGKYRI